MAIILRAALLCRIQPIHFFTAAVGLAPGDHVEVAQAAVLTGLGVAQRAGNPRVGDRPVRLGEEQGYVPDPALVVVDPLLDQAVGTLLGRAREDLRGAHEDLLEGVLGSRRRRAHIDVDRPVPRRAWHAAPISNVTTEDRLDPILADLRHLVRLVGRDADRVLGDLVEDQPAGVPRLGIARGVADRDRTGGDVGDSDIRAPLLQFEGDVVVLYVLASQQRRKRRHRGRSAHRDRRLRRGRGRHRSQEDQRCGDAHQAQFHCGQVRTPFKPLRP